MQFEATIVANDIAEACSGFTAGRMKATHPHAGPMRLVGYREGPGARWRKVGQ